jgi:hypothetical protein
MIDDSKFKAWLKDVNAQLNALCGMDMDDLPDQNYHDEWEAGTSPRSMAKRAIAYAREGL